GRNHLDSKHLRINPTGAMPQASAHPSITERPEPLSGPRAPAARAVSIRIDQRTPWGSPPTAPWGVRCALRRVAQTNAFGRPSVSAAALRLAFRQPEHRMIRRDLTQLVVRGIGPDTAEERPDLKLPLLQI